MLRAFPNFERVTLQGCYTLSYSLLSPAFASRWNPKDLHMEELGCCVISSCTEAGAGRYSVKMLVLRFSQALLKNMLCRDNLLMMPLAESLQLYWESGSGTDFFLEFVQMVKSI